MFPVHSVPFRRRGLLVGSSSGPLALALATLFVSLGVLVSGCANGRVDNDTGRRFPDGAGLDASPLACDPRCTEGFVCLEGTCRAGEDADADGIPSSEDCDDFDYVVGRSAERTCSGECGSGVERCTSGVWTVCDAPSRCDCEPGAAPRMVSCAMCGQQRQVCVDGRWTDDGACTAGSCSPGAFEMGGPCERCGVQARECQPDCTWGAWSCTEQRECAAGASETESEACGGCGGTRTRARTCGADCRWGTDSTWSACSSSGECAAGETQSESVACGNCGLGRATRTRSCDASTCRWGAWVDGTCSGGGTCAPGATRGCANGDSCGVERCNGSCAWGGCEPRDSGGCLRIRPGSSGPPGNNYQCCPRGGGDQGWQFCLSTCRWSTECDATTNC